MQVVRRESLEEKGWDKRDDPKRERQYHRPRARWLEHSARQNSYVERKRRDDDEQSYEDLSS
jgi:hypothetical protein